MASSAYTTYGLADNKLALNAGWDEELLALELQKLVSLDAGFDIGLTGFTIAEVDGLIEGLSLEESASPKGGQFLHLETSPAVTKPSHLWVMGRHRLICATHLIRRSLEP